MNTQEKDCILRVLLITIRSIPPDASEFSTADPLRRPNGLLANPDVVADVVQLLPWRPWRQKRNAAANSIATSSALNSGTAPNIHYVHWPAMAIASPAKIERFWPRAGFAFPFACPALVAILHLQPYDILVADDLECSGHVAWRLHEITGVPYVIIDGNGKQSTQPTSGSAPRKVLQAIQREAEFIVDDNTAVAAARIALFPGIRSRVITPGGQGAVAPPSIAELPQSTVPSLDAARAKKMNEALQFVEILETAVRQAGEIFPW
ncbi:MAG: hypothetical protein ACP5VQ_04230 [Phycisphaerae bacterium]